MSEHDSQDDPLKNLLSDFQDVTGEEPAVTPSRRPSQRPGGKRRPEYRSALHESHTDRRQAAQATGKKAIVAGQYIRRSFTFRPDQLESIEQVANVLGLSQNDLMRWFTDLGIEAVERGEEPPLAEVVRKKYEPHLGGR